MRVLSLLFAVVVSLAATVARAQIYVPEVQVRVAPPPPRTEVRIAAPSPRHTWVAGYWAWRGGQHVWLQGHWALPPHEGMVYEPARWTQRGPNWVFVEGHWRWAQAASPSAYDEPAPPPAAVEVASQPPADIVEVRPATPFGGAVWLPGYWNWNGYHHVWVGGHWSAPRAGWVWEPHRWERGPGGWHMNHGHWRHI
jgi:hypothetical protein